MEGGEIKSPHPSLKEIRERFLDEFSRLDEKTKATYNPSAYSVELSPRLKHLQEELEQQLDRTEIHPPRGLGES
jgi:hypothetical protein